MKSRRGLGPQLVLVLALALQGCASAATPDANAVDASSDTTSMLDATAADTTAPIDTATSDASTLDSPASDAGFGCGALTCDSVSEYCQVLRGRLPDGGAVDDYRCDRWDIGCPSDHTCACLQMNLKCSNGCSASNGGVTTVCGQ